MTNMSSDNSRAIDRWFPCTDVDAACANSAGSGRNEKAIFTWFASRPIAQARAAVACALAAPNAEAQEGKRIALVIGNSAYQNLSGLTNPNNDATDIHEAAITAGVKAST